MHHGLCARCGMKFYWTGTTEVLFKGWCNRCGKRHSIEDLPFHPENKRRQERESQFQEELTQARD